MQNSPGGHNTKTMPMLFVTIRGSPPQPVAPSLWATVRSSRPVRVSPGSPRDAVASMKSTSPPAPVTASPVATPATAVRSAASEVKRGRPR